MAELQLINLLTTTQRLRVKRFQGKYTLFFPPSTFVHRMNPNHIMFKLNSLRVLAFPLLTFSSAMLTI